MDPLNRFTPRDLLDVGFPNQRLARCEFSQLEGSKDQSLCNYFGQTKHLDEKTYRKTVLVEET